MGTNEASVLLETLIQRAPNEPRQMVDQGGAQGESVIEDCLQVRFNGNCHVTSLIADWLEARLGHSGRIRS